MNNQTRRRILILGVLAAGWACATRTAPPTRTSASPLGAAAAAPAPAIGPGAPDQAAAAGDDVERVQVPIEGPVRGPATAKVTIVEFSDFQCPFCSRVVPTLERLQKEYPTQVRISFRNFPLPFHENAALAAEAAVAAEAQGKFWQMHDKLFANQQDLSRAALEKYALQIGLDLSKFRAALDSHAGQARVDADLALGHQVGIEGTPNFFINGRNVRGALPYEEFKRVVEDEIARADKLLAGGTPPAQIYPTLLRRALVRIPAPPPQIFDADAEVYKVPVGDAPARGSTQPKVTIIEFSDFQCPFCSRVNVTLGRLLKDHGNDVELVFRHNPLPFHSNAMPAALASEAARAQGKFWEMHDKLFANQQSLDRPSLEKYAREIGLDLVAFDRAMDAGQGRDRIQRDLDDAVKFGALGTPTFFINGRTYAGAQPIEGFEKVIGDEIKKADAKLAAGTPRGQLYAALTKDGLDKREETPDEAAEKGPEEDQTVYKVDPSKGPSKGPKNAPLQVVIFSDFQCPFCKQIEPTLAQLEKAYGNQIRLVWKNYPLPFHDNAAPAAEAALAAQAQGKFWEMHDKLFADQQHLDRATYEKYAGELGLDLPRFKADLDAQRFKDRIEADRKDGIAVGVLGTPAVFINGRKIGGAYPWETFKQIADTELAKKKGGHRKRE